MKRHPVHLSVCYYFLRGKMKIMLLFLSFITNALIVSAQINYNHFLMAGQTELSKENYTGAINQFNIALSSHKNGFEAWFLRGIAKYSLGDYSGAVSDFTQTVHLHPLYTRAYLYRGISYGKLYNFEAALKDFDKALELDPFDVDVYASKGEVEVQIRDFKGAVDDFTTALRLKKNDFALLLSRGVANHLWGKERAALSDLNKSILLNPFNPDAFLKRGMIYYELDSLDKSINDYNKAIELNKDSPFAYFQRAITLLQMDDTLAAIKDYDKVLELDSSNALTYYNRSLIKAAQKDYDGALSDLEKVLYINPDNLYAWYNRGIIHMETEDYASAEYDFTKTVTLFPEFSGGYINRSVARQYLGDRNGALRDRQRAQSIINAVNTKGNRAGLYKRYADSVYFSKIIRFESDFLSGDMKRGKIQFNRIAIEPKPDIQVMLVTEDELRNPQSVRYYYDSQIVRFNSDNDIGIHLAFTANRNNSIKSSEYDTYLIKAGAVLKTGDTAGYYFIKGMVAYVRGDLKSSIAYYDSTLMVNRFFVYALLNRGVVRFEYNNELWADMQYSGSIGISKSGFSPHGQTLPPPTHVLVSRDYDSLVRHYPALPCLYYNRANLKTALRKFQRAIDDYSHAIELDKNLAEAYFNRALVLLYLKENKLACKDLSKAGELGIEESYSIIKRFCTK